jgi:demethylphylloquinone reductase
MSALKLAAMPWTRLTRPEITLIDQSDRFSFLPMMYELATGEAEEWEVAPRFEALLAGSKISFFQGAVESLTLNDTPTMHVTPIGTASLDGRHKDIPFDRAVLALGCRPRARDSVPGAGEHAIALHGHKSAMELRKKLGALLESKTNGKAINVVVVGGGHSGVETASCIAERLGTAGSVIVVNRDDRILPNGTDYNRVTAERALVERGVGIEYHTEVSKVTEHSVTLRSARSDQGPYSLPADLVVWTAGVQPSEAIASLGVPLDDASGRICVDGLLQVKGHEDCVFALGDGAIMRRSDANGCYAGTAQVAVQQAEYAAWNTWASLTGRPKLEYRYTHLGEMLVLGARDASVSSPLGVEVEGATAWAMRRAAYLARMPTDSHRAKLAVKWAIAPAVSEVSSQVANAWWRKD